MATPQDRERMDTIESKMPVTIKGITRWVEAPTVAEPPAPALLLREGVGIALRDRRKALGMTLRSAAEGACVSLGYISEVERGKKEASSEVLAQLCTALDITLPALLACAAAVLSASAVPDTIPDSILASARLPLTVGA